VASASLIALTNAASTPAQVELLMVAISGGSDGLLTTASHPRCRVSLRQQFRTFVLLCSSL